MKETTLRLGYSALNSWEALMIKEGLITSYDKDFYDRKLTDSSQHTRVDNKKFLLFSLILFDKIDASNLSMFNMDKLIDYGIVDEHAHMIEAQLDNMDEIALTFHNLNTSMYQFDQTLSVAKEAAEEIMLANKSKIIKALLKQERLHEYSFLEQQEISKNYNEWLQDCEFWGSSKNFHNSKESMGIIKESIMYGIYDSIQSGSVYYDGSIVPIKNNNIVETNISAQDISQIMNIDLSPVLYHMPIPSTVSEALILRDRPEIVSFRNIFFEWCTALKQGDIDMATRIKKDINLADQELKKYYKWENDKTKLFNCIIDVAVGQIPYFSSLVGSISPFQTRRILKKKNKNSWLLLLK